MNSSPEPVRDRHGHKLAAVGMREPCLVLVEGRDEASLLLAQSACDDSVTTRLILGGVTFVRAGTNRENCQTMAQVAIYESDDRWVAEDAVSHEIILEPAKHPYELVFISKEDYRRLQSCIAKGTMGLVMECARRLLKGLPLGNRDTTEPRYAAAQAALPQAKEALARLCEAYWYPLYAFVRRQGHNPHEAGALVQDFICRLLEKNLLPSGDSSRSRFRSFFLSSFKHYLINARRPGQSRKRPTARGTVSLDVASAEARYAAGLVDDTSPEKLYDCKWAWTLLDRALERLRAEQKHKAALFDRLKPVLMDQLNPAYAELAAEFRTTKATLRMTVSYLRCRFRRLLQEEIAQTVASPKEIDDEIRHLFAALGGG